jgi:hypothetical protein
MRLKLAFDFLLWTNYYLPSTPYIFTAGFVFFEHKTHIFAQNFRVGDEL